MKYNIEINNINDNWEEGYIDICSIGNNYRILYFLREDHVLKMDKISNIAIYTGNIIEFIRTIILLKLIE